MVFHPLLRLLEVELLTLERGDWSSGSFVSSSIVSSQDITVSSTDTLASLRDKINDLNYGVTSSIVGTGDGTFNLVLKNLKLVLKMHYVLQQLKVQLVQA